VVVIENVALVAPAGTVTLAGVVAAAELSDSVTTAPPAGAALVNVAVPVAEPPPVTLVGFTVTADKLAAAGGGFTVNVAVRVAPPNAPVIVTGVAVVTLVVVIEKVALVAPAGTVTLAGVVAAAELSESVTTAPPVGAALVRVAVPVEPAGPTTLAGLTDSADRLTVPGSACGVKRRVEENAPNTPAALRARTRHHSRCAGSPPIVAWDSVVVWLTTKGAEMLEVVSIWIS
jgi:hypothetical protein